MKQVVYVASPDSQQIHVWQLAHDGNLALLQTVAVAGQVQPMVISADKRYLYTGIRSACGIVSWRIMPDGQLEQLGVALLPAVPTHISTSHCGKLLFCASYSGHCVTVSPIDNKGVVQEPLQQIDELPAPHSVNIDPGRPLLLVPCLKEDRVRLFDFNSAGRLNPHYTQMALNTAAGAGPRHMQFHPHYAVVYCVNELHGSVDVYQITAGGSYCRAQTLDALPADFIGARWAADIHVTPDGRYLYISERTNSILSIFSITQRGLTVTLLGHHPTEIQPRGFNIDHSGNFLIAAGQKTNHIAVYRIEQQSGRLALLARYPVGHAPVWVTILPLSR